MTLSELINNPNTTHWGITSKGQYFELYNEQQEQILTIRFSDYPSPSFSNAELKCTKTGDTITYTTAIYKAKQLLKTINNK